MNNRFLLALLLIFGGVLFGLYIQQGYQKDFNLVGKLAPDFILQDGLGNTVKLSDQRGKVVLVHFWATWCPPCVEEIPYLNVFYKTMLQDSFVLLAVSVDQNKVDVQKFREKYPFDFSVLYDVGEKVSSQYGTFTFPESFLINKEGRIIKKYIGPQNWSNPSLVAEIKGVTRNQ